MRQLLALTAFAGILAGQVTLTTSIDKANLRPGETANLIIGIAGQSAPTVTALLLTREPIPPNRLNIGLPAITGAASAAMKVRTCGSTLSSRCAVYNVGAPNAIANGNILTAIVTAPANAAPGEVLIRISDVSAAAADGTAVPILPPADLRVTVLPPQSPLDVNRDGRVDIIDVNLIVQQAIGNVAVTTCDLNADTICNVLDVQLVAAAAVP